MLASKISGPYEIITYQKMQGDCLSGNFMREAWAHHIASPSGPKE